MLVVAAATQTHNLGILWYQAKLIRNSQIILTWQQIVLKCYKDYKCKLADINFVTAANATLSKDPEKAFQEQTL